jgi:excisionase family DNA binding protein
MKITSPDNRGWAKVKDAAKYAGVSVRTLRDWLKDGLRHSRVRGTILISYTALDEYLRGFEVRDNQGGLS